MKKIKKFGTTFLFTIILFSCNSSNSNIELDSENPIFGNWKLVEAFISSGGPQYWVTIDNGEEFKFSQSGTFTSTKYQECSGGSFSTELNELILRYNCSGFTTGIENSEGNVTYEMTFESNNLILIPTSAICIEGCSYKFKKISN